MEEENVLIIYKTEDGKSRIECLIEADTLWLTINQIANLFERDKSFISKHLKNIFEDNELNWSATVALFATVQKEGDREVERKIEHYNLEAIFAVGYRVRSPRGAQFRGWATAHLKEYLKSGFVMDDERLKNPESSVLLEKLLARIRDIRSSEKVFWRKICDIYATSIDYDGQAETSRTFRASPKQDALGGSRPHGRGSGA